MNPASRNSRSRLTLGVLVGVVIAAACGGKIAGDPAAGGASPSGDDDVNGGGEGPVDGGIDDPGSADGSTPASDSAPPVEHCSVKAPPGADCYESDQATAFVPTSYLPSVARQAGKCSDAQINFVVDSCIGGGNCSAAVSGAGACGSCLFSVVSPGAASTFAVGPIYEDQRKNPRVRTVNAAGCFDVLTGIPGCGAKTLNRISCGSGSCCTCSDQASIDACQAKASAASAPCTSQLDDACRQAVIATGALTTCLAASSSSADTVALGQRVGAVFCK